MIYIYGRTLSEAYHKALLALQKSGAIVYSPDWKTNRMEISLVMEVGEATREPMISKCFIGGPRELQQYKMEVCDGILDFMIGKGESMWKYTYHQRIANQLDFVIDELRRNPASTRAVIDIRDNKIDMQSDHPACLQHMQFTIRDEKLNLTALMRSNDAPEATFMNAFAFICLQDNVAKKLHIKTGSYTHIANSFHAYQKDWELLDNYCKRISNSNDTYYHYKLDWEPIMQSYAYGIMESTVKPLKEVYDK